MTSQIARLLEIVKALRHPETGCPWDKEQTLQTITKYTIEETYELVDAIMRDDTHDIEEELGDLLLQICLYAEIGSETKKFDFESVAGKLADKLIHRHPHVFGDAKADNSADVMDIWAERKKLEGKDKPKDSALDGVKQGMPPLLRARKLQDKAAANGFEWQKLDHIFEKLQEEIAELREAVATKSQQEISDEYGDVQFVLANIARWLKLDAEQVLQSANNKFERRFRGMETILKQQQKELKSSTLDDMNIAWDEVKRAEKRS
ncbi:MAG: nucleoside triphosphate pyrophosphohydrolase [Alphaproteobacteria bacterium]|nr:nucleoside triphosphate pyrophosphohydrolase [Alphaproteobacteria bacterium]